jgi:hypothetical protein
VSMGPPPPAKTPTSRASIIGLRYKKQTSVLVFFIDRG